MLFACIVLGHINILIKPFSVTALLSLGCIDDLNFEVIDSGHDVNLTCRRQKSEGGNSLFWMRLMSGRLPEILGATYTFDYDGVTKTPHFTAKQEPEKFLLHIHETQVNDTGFYYCVKVDMLTVTLVNATFLRIKGKHNLNKVSCSYFPFIKYN